MEVNETNILINESGYENGEYYLTISDDTIISLDGEKDRCAWMFERNKYGK